ncbi:hypothetical protein [Sphingomonas baiyangensis]|uniref:Uncharacterized protein n=1 Tax=Sphingomonas baiyangensis TaxID=2572576 RepID=A0A4U1L290_9SPHN|nr:hypothetical protein [Sphingomonas baiyangensis]TKD50330.1 hypothetical protein FBR43_05820 [Sphingomonas baiyangensis]
MRFVPLIALALLAACGPGENDPGPGGVTMSEARELNEAAAMLEPDSVSANALDNGSDQP